MISADGSIKYLNDANLEPLELVGVASKRRASHVHPVNKFLRVAFYGLRLFGDNSSAAKWTRSWGCHWLVDLALSGGPVLGPFVERSKAIEAEERWLEANTF